MNAINLATIIREARCQGDPGKSLLLTRTYLSDRRNEWTGFMGGKQFGFGDYEQTTVRKRTRRVRFLGEMEAVVPRKPLINLIEPDYPKTCSKGGRSAYPHGDHAPGRSDEAVV